MKSLLPRSFSRSLPTILPSSQSNQDHILSLPDYYRDTRREVYGPNFSIETHSVRTMELPYDNPDECYRRSFLLDLEPPEHIFEIKGLLREQTLESASLQASLSSCTCVDEVPLPPPASEKNDCFRVGRALLHGFVSLVCGARRHWRRRN